MVGNMMTSRRLTWHGVVRCAHAAAATAVTAWIRIVDNLVYYQAMYVSSSNSRLCVVKICISISLWVLAGAYLIQVRMCACTLSCCPVRRSSSWAEAKSTARVAAARTISCSCL